MRHLTCRKGELCNYMGRVIVTLGGGSVTMSGSDASGKGVGGRNARQKIKKKWR